MDLLHPDAFRLLGDPVRLRLLRLLAREPLNVGEVTRIIGVAQSGVSSHVRLLRGGRFVAERRAAAGPGWTWRRPAARAGWAGCGRRSANGSRRPATRRRRRPPRRGAPRAGGAGRGAAERRSPPSPGGRGRPGPGRSGTCCRALAAVDLGCAEGALTLEVARWAGRVVGVDPSAAALERARAAAEAPGRGTSSGSRAPLDAVPLPSASADVALLAQVLHRVEDPSRVLAEAVRLVATGRPGAGPRPPPSPGGLGAGAPGPPSAGDLRAPRHGPPRGRPGSRRCAWRRPSAGAGTRSRCWVASGRRAGDEPRTRGGEAAR